MSPTHKPPAPKPKTVITIITITVPVIIAACILIVLCSMNKITADVYRTGSVQASSRRWRKRTLLRGQLSSWFTDPEPHARTGMNCTDRGLLCKNENQETKTIRENQGSELEACLSKLKEQPEKETSSVETQGGAAVLPQVKGLYKDGEETGYQPDAYLQTTHPTKERRLELSRQ